MLFLPIASLNVQVREKQNEKGIDVFGSPTQRHIDSKVEDEVGDEHHINSQYKQLEYESGAGVACTRYGLEVDVGRNHEQVG